MIPPDLKTTPNSPGAFLSRPLFFSAGELLHCPQSLTIFFSVNYFRLYHKHVLHPTLYRISSSKYTVIYLTISLFGVI